MAAAAGITTSGGVPTAVVNVQPGVNVQPVVLVDQNGQYVTPGGTATTAGSLATTTSPVNVAAATAPSTGQALIATSGTTATWQFVPIASGGTGGTTATSAYNNLSPMTTLGDIEYESGANTAARLAGNTTTTVKFLSQTGTGSASAAPTWSVVSGQYLCAPNAYAPGSPTNVSVSTTTLAAFSSGTICTNSFTAPASGSVVVGLSCVMAEATAGNNISIALAAKGTVTPVVGNVITFKQSGSATQQPESFLFYVTGLAAGTGYQFDLLGACAAGTSSATIVALGSTSTTPTGSAGAPAVMTVQAV